MTADVQHLEVAGRSVAYRKREGEHPTIVFLAGYGSDMEGTKALSLDVLAERRGLAMLRFDYSGTGSSGGKFEEGTLAHWLEETVAAVDRLTVGPLFLVGSSMGAWIAMHVALLRPLRVNAIVAIASALDFTDWGRIDAPAEAQQEWDGCEEPAVGTGEPRRFTRSFWESAKPLLLLANPIAVDCPVRLIHGENDQDVPIEVAYRTMRALRSADVQLTVVKGGGHRLSQPREIDVIRNILANLLETAS